MAVIEWTGAEARALRAARRRSVRDFAQELGVAVRTVSNWEAKGASYRPRPDTQAILDTALARCDPATVLLFETLLSETASRPGPARVPTSGPRLWEYETWVDDLERAVAAISRQDFAFASDLLGRWWSRWPARDLDDKGLYLYARTTTLVGDLQRDQGSVLGPLSAARSYLEARSVFEQLAVPRRIAQLDLSLAVVSEMSGRHTEAADRYQQLAADPRLSGRDRARAQLWVGTALDKTGNHTAAAGFMSGAVRLFDSLGEPEDWSVAHQKLALAHRGAGDLAKACELIEVARRTGTTASPMQQVRLATAEGHILLSDPGTADEGLAVLGRAADTAAHYGMSHQLRSIEGIRRGFEQPARSLQRI
ncbi:transcriptional regulator with XRE-family HTH domain [Kitasatospora gansuensis]|uniref:Transcriptional regulator with XRE-family HTH domain n=1 Tax=Kitasatospora gansuensis TaxID=258050 RepID=A0A7W7SJV1_9ACTN|nr:transcriptional regulator with XRE-family HTH domain [Kitasatospora gansuensis]